MINLLLIPLICAFYGSPCIESVETQEKPLLSASYNDQTRNLYFAPYEFCNQEFIDWFDTKVPNIGDTFNFEPTLSLVQTSPYSITKSITRLVKSGTNAYQLQYVSGNTTTTLLTYRKDTIVNAYVCVYSSSYVTYTHILVPYSTQAYGTYWQSFKQLYDNISNIGTFEQRYQEGIQVGYDDGYRLGYDNGNNDGLTTGYNNGFNTGKQEGYQEGYNAGVLDTQEQDQTALTIFTGILEVGLLPVNVFLSIFNYEIFGVNLSGLVSAFLTITIVIILIKVITGSGGGKKDV